MAAVNDAPILHDDHGTTNEDEPMTFQASQLLGNDRPGPTAPPGTADNEQAQTLTVISVSPVSAQGGTVTFDSEHRSDHLHAAARLLRHGHLDVSRR